MSTTFDQLFQSALRTMCQAAQTNLELQQGFLVGWTRFWPGFSGRRVGDGVCELHRQWSEGVMRAARTQRMLWGQQWEVAEAALGLATDWNRDRSAPTAELAPLPNDREETSGPLPVSPDEGRLPAGAARNIYQKIAVVTGAASGIGEAVARELAHRGVRAVMLVDRSEAVHDVARLINAENDRVVAVPRTGDTTDEGFRKRVFNDAMEQYGLVTICVPAAGITRDALSVRFNHETKRAEMYPVETFRKVTEVNLVAPIYWGIEMLARIVEDRVQRGLKRWEPEEAIQGVVVFLGSVSSQGNKGQISYAVAKAGLEGAAATLTKEAMFHGVRCGVIHPGFTDTPMVRALGSEFLKKSILPYTQLRRLIRPDEIADAICFMISNAAVSGELWADAGWHPPA